MTIMATGASYPTILGVYPEDMLLQQLASTEDEWSVGAASYGPGGTWDAMRKITVSATLMQIRESLPEKVTEKVLDAMAHADGEYAIWVQDHTVKRAQWLALDAKRSRLYMEIKSIQARGYDARRNGV